MSNTIKRLRDAPLDEQIDHIESLTVAEYREFRTELDAAIEQLERKAQDLKALRTTARKAIEHNRHKIAFTLGEIIGIDPLISLVPTEKTANVKNPFAPAERSTDAPNRAA